jgi:hypothetical protein
MTLLQSRRYIMTQRLKEWNLSIPRDLASQFSPAVTQSSTFTQKVEEARISFATRRSNAARIKSILTSFNRHSRIQMILHRSIMKLTRVVPTVLSDFPNLPSMFDLSRNFLSVQMKLFPFSAIAR